MTKHRNADYLTADHARIQRAARRELRPLTTAEIFKVLNPALDRIADRWQDEWQYESQMFEDYLRPILAGIGLRLDGIPAKPVLTLDCRVLRPLRMGDTRLVPRLRVTYALARDTATLGLKAVYLYGD